MLSAGNLVKVTAYKKNNIFWSIFSLGYKFLEGSICCFFFLKSLYPKLRQEDKGATEDEMVGWHHQFNGHEFEQAPGVGDGQRSLVCCRPWGCKESDTTERLNNNNNPKCTAWGHSRQERGREETEVV